jgi:hypothetical protein
VSLLPAPDDTFPEDAEGAPDRRLRSNVWHRYRTRQRFNWRFYRLARLPHRFEFVPKLVKPRRDPALRGPEFACYL